METSQKEQNKKFYNELTKNLYITDDRDVYRAENIQEALKLANAKKYNLGEDEHRQVRKFEMKGDQDEKLLHIIGLLHIVSDSENSSSLDNEIYHSAGDYLFTLNHVQEDLIRKSDSVRIIIKLLKGIMRKWNNDFSAISLFIEEMKEKRDSIAA